jgi:hypothetical protein
MAWFKRFVPTIVFETHHKGTAGQGLRPSVWEPNVGGEPLARGRGSCVSNAGGTEKYSRKHAHRLYVGVARPLSSPIMVCTAVC